MKQEFFKSRKFNRIRLALLFSLMYFLLMLVTIAIMFAGAVVLMKLGFINFRERERVPFFAFSIACLIVGTVVSFVFSRIPLKPLREIISASDKIANGDYSTRVHIGGIGDLQRLNDSFNHMAEELASVEMLRTDFVNNFSHEFKTPIVSIRGFAKMLKNGDLSDEEREEYLDIIISESERLSELSMNVLSLSKIEQQTILTDKARFNLSEQIRLVIAMLYEKWDKKHLDIDFDCEEIYCIGDEEMLKQVWINLIDNAIKFSPEYNTISISIKQAEGYTYVSIFNQGEPITDEQARHIFDKFYQADTSRTTKGNGLGLAIAKSIVELHKGTIRVNNKCKDGTEFVVELV